MGGERELAADQRKTKHPGFSASPPTPADIFRRMEQRPRRPGWLDRGPRVGLLAVVATGGVIAYQTALKPTAPAAHALFITPGNGAHP